MNILIPITITDAMLTASSIAEPAPGETAWVSAGTYVLGDSRIRTTTHRVYECIQDHTGRTAFPEDDPLYWSDADPTQKLAPFDSYVSTPATASGVISYDLTPGFFDAVTLYGLVGDSLTLTVTDGASVLDTRTISLHEESGGLYEYLFTPARPRSKVVASGMPIHPTAQLSITLTGSGDVAVGMINVGQYRQIVNPASWGGTQYGATAEPMTYSRIKTDEFGNTSIKRGNAATGMRATVILPIADANYALQTIQQVLDTPSSFVATPLPNYAGLNVFGLGSASMSYESASHVQLTITVKGMI